MGHIHRYSMHCCKKQTSRFHLLLLLSSNCQVCWTIIVHRQYYWYQRQFLKMCCWNGCEAQHEPGIAVLPRPQTHLQWLFSPKHISLRNEPLPTSDRTFSSTPAGGAPVSSLMRDDASCHRQHMYSCIALFFVFK